jgi:hypothetical protein
MSCEIAAAAMLWLAAATGPVGPEPKAAPPAVAHEPLFADIVARAGGLKSQVDALRGTPTAALPDAFKTGVAELAELDMKGHVTLAQRGTDGDLKCILKGIAQDLPAKLEALEAATDAKARDAALRDMAYLLNDNVEVITAPPAPEV